MWINLQPNTRRILPLGNSLVAEITRVVQVSKHYLDEFQLSNYLTISNSISSSIGLCLSQSWLDDMTDDNESRVWVFKMSMMMHGWRVAIKQQNIFWCSCLIEDFLESAVTHSNHSHLSIPVGTMREIYGTERDRKTQLVSWCGCRRVFQ